MSNALVWLRCDLRLSDNPALTAALKAGGAVTAVYIYETDAGLRAPGAAARWWLHDSLEDLGTRLAGIGVTLRVETGRSSEIVPELARHAGSVHWNRRYGPADRAIDAAIKAALGDKAQSHAGNVLVEPWDISTGTGAPYSVFTPFWKSLRQMAIALPLHAPDGRGARPSAPFDSGYVEPAWAQKLSSCWTVGEEAAQAALHAFLDERIEGYPVGRDVPARQATSRLSPHLRFGEISARQVWHAARTLADRDHATVAAIDKFLSELAWRDFNYHQLYHRPDIASAAMNPKYERMEWRHAPSQLRAWQQGQTGIPIVDAGMRELWQTGYMENRVRMLAASFLSKNLLIDWRVGEAWFWDCLVDSDPANNPGNWQWVAGSGMDASPFFRIFNPVTQGERFDADGAYVRRRVPELAALPDEWVQRPFDAPAEVLSRAGVALGTRYPRPIVDLKESRARALEAAKRL